MRRKSPSAAGRARFKQALANLPKGYGAKLLPDGDIRLIEPAEERERARKLFAPILKNRQFWVDWEAMKALGDHLESARHLPKIKRSPRILHMAITLRKDFGTLMSYATVVPVDTRQRRAEIARRMVNKRNEHVVRFGELAKAKYKAGLGNWKSKSQAAGLIFNTLKAEKDWPLKGNLESQRERVYRWILKK